MLLCLSCVPLGEAAALYCNVYLFPDPAGPKGSFGHSTDAQPKHSITEANGNSFGSCCGAGVLGLQVSRVFYVVCLSGNDSRCNLKH